MNEEETKAEEDERGQVFELGLCAESADSYKIAADARTLSLFLSELTNAVLVPEERHQ